MSSPTKDQTTARYEYNRGGSFCLTSLINTHGNTTAVTYEPGWRVQKVTDASGLRYAWINWGSQYLESSVQLAVPGTSRTWDFITDANSNLTQITFPAPVSGGARPNIRMTYDDKGKK